MLTSQVLPESNLALAAAYAGTVSADKRIVSDSTRSMQVRIDLFI